MSAAANEADTGTNGPTGSRIKGLAILATLILSGGVFLAWSQNWMTLTFTASGGTDATVDVPGSVAAPALAALGLAGLALAAALAIAGPVVRIVLAILQGVLGACIALSGIEPLLDPIAAGSPRVTTTTGVAGIESVRAITSGVVEGPWAIVAVVLGVFLVVVAAAVLVTSKRWPVSGRKYQAVRFAAEDGTPVDSFGELTDDQDNRAAEPSIGSGIDGSTPAPADSGDDSPGTTTEPQSAVDTQTAKRAAAVDNWDSLTQGRDPTA